MANELYSLANNNKTKIKKAFERPINEIIISCLFQMEICDPTFFKPAFNTLYGLCMKIDVNRSVSKKGEVFGLDLQILLDSPSEKNLITPYSGLQLIIFNRSLSFIRPDHKITSIKSSEHTNIEVAIILFKYCFKFDYLYIYKCYAPFITSLCIIFYC